MEVLKKPFGVYETNCYILKFPQGEIVIDAGMGAGGWVKQECKNPLVFLNTHGHFDHIWDNAILKESFPKTPLICHQKDAFMLESDCFALGLIPCVPDRVVEGEKCKSLVEIAGIEIGFWHYPGHTPGCCMIEIENILFSGDFIFYHCVGRSDFEYSNPQEMRESLQRFKSFPKNCMIYPGHGGETSVLEEQKHLDFWIQRT